MLDIDTAIKHCLEVAEQKEHESFIDRWSDDDEWSESVKEECRQCAADHRQLAEWLTELKKAKAMILDTSYTLEVMCDKVSTKIGCKRCTYYDEETHGCEVRKWIDKMRTFCKGR